MEDNPVVAVRRAGSRDSETRAASGTYLSADEVGPPLCTGEVLPHAKAVRPNQARVVSEGGQLG
eukprot:40815-Hanusia_phi.AAC.1